jgi:hypothetical protein
MREWIRLRAPDISPGGFVPSSRSSGPRGPESGGGVCPLPASSASAIPAPPTEGG